MNYTEIPLQPEFDSLVCAFWTLDAGESGNHAIQHRATPDGCVEVIHRLRGHSTWQREQPEHFVAGLITRPADLLFGGDAAFVGLRLWPWTWHALGGRACVEFINDWIPLTAAALPAATCRRLLDLNTGNPPELAALLTPSGESDIADVGRAVLACDSVAALSRRTGRSARWLQRWFARYVGVAPRTYLRLLRFQDTLRAMQTGQSSLTHEAAEHGYADQAHMAREFRALTGGTASTARKKGRGPFV